MGNQFQPFIKQSKNMKNTHLNRREVSLLLPMTLTIGIN